MVINNIFNMDSKYVGYLQSLESSGILFSDDIEKIKGEWCFGMKIFEADGLNNDTLKILFPDKPERGTVLKWLEENKVEVYSSGNMVQTV